MTDLTLPPNGTGTVQITAMTEDGEVFGAFLPLKSAGNLPLFHAYQWSKSKGAQDMGTLGADGLCINGVNGVGQGVGFTQKMLSFKSPISVPHAMVGGPNGILLLPTTADASDAVSINDAGFAAGNVFTGQTTTAVLWDTKKGTVISLGTAALKWSQANDINSQGIVVGAAGASSSAFAACYWDASHKLIPLGPTTYTQSAVVAVSETGVMAGYVRQGEIQQGGVWDARGKFTPLPVSSAFPQSSLNGIASGGNRRRLCHGERRQFPRHRLGRQSGSGFERPD